MGLLKSLGSALCGSIAGARGAGLQAIVSSTAAQQGLNPWRHLSTSAAQSATAQAEKANESNREPDGSGSQPGGSEASTSSPRADAGFSSGFRRVVSSRPGQQLGSLSGIVHIQNTFNNIMMTLTDKDGSIKASTSAGQVGFRGARKSQPVAAERAAEELAKRALRLGYSTVDVRLKGPGGNKQYAVQSLASSGLNIATLADVTPIPYNGCRPRKRRRV